MRIHHETFTVNAVNAEDFMHIRWCAFRYFLQQMACKGFIDVALQSFDFKQPGYDLSAIISVYWP